MEDCSSVIQGEHQKRPVRRSMTSQTSIGLKKMRSLVAATKTLRRKCSRLKEMNSNLHSQLEKLKKDFFEMKALAEANGALTLQRRALLEPVRGMLLGSVFLVALQGCCTVLGTVLVTYEANNLVVDLVSAPQNSTLFLLQLQSHASGCMDTKAATVKEVLLIQEANMRASYSRDSLEPGRYCALVVSPSGNITSEEPLELEEGHRGKDLSGANDRMNREPFKRTVKLFESKVLQCEKLHVALWAPWGSARPQSIPCVDSIRFVDEEIQTIANLSVVVKFENLSAGNYCVRVSPRCEPPEDCLTLTSKVIELFSAQGGSREPTGGAKARQSRLLWLLLLPLLVGAALVIALGAFWVRRQSLLARKRPFIVGSPLPSFHKPRVDPGPPVVKVVYSRDSDSHVTAVSRLCELLQRELGFCVEWDEASAHLAHLTHDWAMAMAQLSCPHYNLAAKAATPVKMLDLGQVSESNIDELYHTTYAALLSNQAQALDDYCHILGGPAAIHHTARSPRLSAPKTLSAAPPLATTAPCSAARNSASRKSCRSGTTLRVAQPF
ncbi:hypothetical protein MRX96_023488 [Rhipicephalus microplus]